MTSTTSTLNRCGNKWNTNEILRLQREYELLEMTIQEIAVKHERSDRAILFKLLAESFIDKESSARGYNEMVNYTSNNVEILQPSLNYETLDETDTESLEDNENDSDEDYEDEDEDDKDDQDYDDNVKLLQEDVRYTKFCERLSRLETLVSNFISKSTPSVTPLRKQASMLSY